MLTCKQCASPNVFEQFQLCFKCASLRGVLTEIKGRSQTGYVPNGYREESVKDLLLHSIDLFVPTAKSYLKDALLQAVSFTGQSDTPFYADQAIKQLQKSEIRAALRFQDLQVVQDLKDPTKYIVSYDTYVLSGTL